MFDNFTFVASVAALWLVSGLSLSLVMARRGHNGFGWLVVGTLFGPLAFVLAVDARRHEEGLRPEAVREVRRTARPGAIDVLAGYDGSAESRQAVEAVLRLLGDRLDRLTLATVVPFADVAGAEAEARASLRQVADGNDRITGLEILHGRPSDALREWAQAGGYDLIAVGSRGAGLSKLIVGSAASELAAGGRIPVLVTG